MTAEDIRQEMDHVHEQRMRVQREAEAKIREQRAMPWKVDSSPFDTL